MSQVGGDFEFLDLTKPTNDKQSFEDFDPLCEKRKCRFEVKVHPIFNTGIKENKSLQPHKFEPMVIPDNAPKQTTRFSITRKERFGSNLSKSTKNFKVDFPINRNERKLSDVSVEVTVKLSSEEEIQANIGKPKKFTIVRHSISRREQQDNMFK